MPKTQTSSKSTRPHHNQTKAPDINESEIKPVILPAQHYKTPPNQPNQQSHASLEPPVPMLDAETIKNKWQQLTSAKKKRRYKLKSEASIM